MADTGNTEELADSKVLDIDTEVEAVTDEKSETKVKKKADNFRHKCHVCRAKINVVTGFQCRYLNLNTVYLHL
jgi:hypothetical protein